jgi:hypothetical protein
MFLTVLEATGSFSPDVGLHSRCVTSGENLYKGLPHRFHVENNNMTRICSSSQPLTI